MNDPQDLKPTAEAPVNATRRRLAKASLAAPAVLGVLASRPVLGQVPYQCTTSGIISGNTSVAPAPKPCSGLGRSPGYWKHPDLHAWPGLDPNAKFKSVFHDAYWYQIQNHNTVKLYMPGTMDCTPDPTLLQVINCAGGMEAAPYPALGRAAVATLCNAYYFAPNFPLQPTEVVNMFNAVCMGGSYSHHGVQWNAMQVLCYWESLYNPESGETEYCSLGWPNLP